MKKCWLVLFLVIGAIGAIGASMVYAATEAYDDVPLLVRKVTVTGFKLYDTRIYKQIDKKYRNKRLTSKEIDGVIEELLAAYRAGGYNQLVNVTHQLRKGILTIHVGVSKE